MGVMTTFGYFLSCEEYTPAELIDQAERAEDAGFEALWISDHFHPWNDEQGQSPFVWSMIGAISQVVQPARHDGGDVPDGPDASRPSSRRRPRPAPSCSTAASASASAPARR